MDAPPAQTGSRPRVTQYAILLALLALTVAGFCLRHTGVHAYLPHEGEPHERVYATQVELLREGRPKPERNVDFDYYPLLVARIALATEPAPVATPRTFEEHCAACSADIEHLRTLIALLAALGVPATYALARRFLTPGWSLLAAAFFATSPLAISFAQQARPHAAIVAPMIASVLACLLVQRRPVLSSYVLCGVALGSALAILHNGVAVLPALLVAHALRDRSRARRAWIGLGVAVAVAALIAIATYPRGFGGVQSTSWGEQAELSGHHVFMQQFSGGGFPILALALKDYEPWMTAVGAVGAFLWIVCRWRARDLLRVRGNEALWVIAAWCVPYAIAIGMYDISYERFLIPLLPLFACSAAYLVASVSGLVGASTRTPVLASSLAAALALAPQAYVAVRLARAMGATDTITQSAHWIRANIPPGSARLAVFNTIDLPLLRTEVALRDAVGDLVDVTRPWLVYQQKLDPSVLASERYDMVTVPRGGRVGIELFRKDLPACVASWNADYVILEVYTSGRRANIAAMRALLQRTATRVARFSPYADDDGLESADQQPFGYSHNRFGPDGWWTGHLLHADGFGPVVEVYRMR